jgi:serine/threonine protein kinase
VDRERSIHAALRHPNIVRLFTSFEDETNIYLVMEQATQGDLFMKMCAATQHFSERTIVAEFLQPLLLSLDQLHTLGILHRDIKPENLLVCGDGTLKLADFGLAVDRREERPITRAGTLDYMVRAFACVCVHGCEGVGG